MKYTIRAVKYFLMMTVILVLILGVLTWLTKGNLDITQSLDQGWTSVAWIALILAVFSAIYPRFGYAERPLDLRGDREEIAGVIKDYMTAHGYRLESEKDGLLTFRHNSAVSRLFKVWEDRITFTPTHSGYTIEGLNRDIVRYLSGIEYKFQNRDIL